jgi:hypothetical protein
VVTGYLNSAAKGIGLAHQPEHDTRYEIAEATDSHFRTDESGIYWKIGEEFASHRTVNHSANEYVRGDAHTNTVEGFFSIIKRGIYGVYHHVSQASNYRTALGFDDTARATLAIKGIAGKRLTYRQPIGEAHA